MARLVIAAIFALSLHVPSAFAWWNPDWSSRKVITVDTTVAGLNVTTPVANLPVLLRLHSGNFPQFLNVKEGGADFRIIAGDDKTPLKYHVERFDVASQIAFVWVKVPNLLPQSKENKLYLYFGNQKATKADDIANTFDVDTAANFHFADLAGAVVDSTAYAVPTLGHTISNPASLIGSGASMSGTASSFQVQDASSLRLMGKGWAASLWVKFDAIPTAVGYLLDRSDRDQRFSLIVSGGHVVARVGAMDVTAPTPITAGQWTHLAVSIVSGQLELFVNGKSAGKVPVNVSEMGGAINVGGGVGGEGLLAMQLDELRFYTGAKTPDFFLAEAGIEGEKNELVMHYSADENQDNAGTEGETKSASRFGTIVQFVFGNKEAIVEQTVIGVCLVMAAAAFLVMFIKASALGRNRRASARFLDAYHTQVTATQLDALVEGEASFGDSPLFRVYRQGLDEVRRRLDAAATHSGIGLDAKSINSIRASLDATMVRESQKINSLLVLLTIAISGGPFIGLLGTVVGVMVTFATIASTGDVNISAIAPGMAAALLATVAGLGVAIPALFGYNYLGSRAKEGIADMRVFADEFLARLNEAHGA